MHLIRTARGAWVPGVLLQLRIVSWLGLGLCACAPRLTTAPVSEPPAAAESVAQKNTVVVLGMIYNPRTMAEKQGVHPRYYQLLDGRHDLLVDADVSAVSEIVVTVPELVYADALRVEPDCAAGADVAQKSQVRIFRLPGQQWTQVFCPIKPYSSFKLGELVSRRLATRCLQIEVTDDAWGGHVLFDQGDMKELSLFCTGYDLRNVCPRFGLPVPEMDEEDIYDSSEFFHSELRPDQATGDLASLAKLLGLWVDAGEAPWSPSMRVERLDLLYPS